MALRSLRPNINRETETVFQTLVRTLSEEDFAMLYGNPSSCLAVYKSLDPFSQYLVRTMLLTTPPLPLTPGQPAPVRWWTGDSVAALRHPDRTDWSILPLLHLHVLFRTENQVALRDGLGNATGTAGASYSYCLRQPFADNLRLILGGNAGVLQPLLNQGSGPFPGPGSGAPPSQHELPPARLEKFARRRWEKLLYVIVGHGEEDAVDTSDKRLLRVLVKGAGLVRSEDEDDGGGVAAPTDDEDEKPLVFQVTSFGFQFLLLDLRAQLSVVMRQFVDMALRLLNVAKVDSFAFLFQLGQLRVGCPYPLSQLQPFQSQLVRELATLGFVRRKTVKVGPNASERVFYVSPLASEFCSVGASDIVARWNIPGLHGPIIVQTNFHLYAYTDSPIQIALISLFSKMQYKLPNLVTAVIDRSSVRAALVNGITADQIISYLWVHAHPKMREQRHRVPVNISNQIRLWEKERNRITACPGMWLDNFRDLAQYEAAVRLARERGWLLWCNVDPKLCVVVRLDEEYGVDHQKEDLRTVVESIVDAVD